MLNKLTPEQIKTKIAFIDNYVNAQNAAEGSIVDPNSNVTSKNISTMEAEMYKFENIQVNRHIVCKKLEELFPGEGLAEQYLKDIHDHLIYIHDETSLKPYCASITLYPFLMEGSKVVGGTSRAPKNLQSFCGSYVNLMYQIAGQFAGAVATVEFLMYFDYFARKTYGDNYLVKHEDIIKQELQGVVYSMNQPAAARGFQSIFWNISIFDSYYFESLFDEFYFPDGSKPNYASLEKLQGFFMEWFRKERAKELLTFPVVTAAYLVDKETRKPKDTKFIELLADQMSKGHSFFHYESDSADSLASCCRLRNELADNTFSYTLGAGGVSTGSVQVITINFNRLVQDGVNFEATIRRVQKYLMAHHSFHRDMIKSGMLPAYSAGFIDIDKQFCTIGINGMLESWEYLKEKAKICPPQEYSWYLRGYLIALTSLNKEALKTYGVRFNTEFVPAENLGVKNAKWDREDGLYVPRDCYNSYFYPVEDPNWTILDRIKIHGKDIAQYLDGGAALHLNLGRIPTFAEALTLIGLNAQKGVPYWTTNVLCTVCRDCGNIDPNTYKKCPKCDSDNVDYGTRVIGYLKLISNFSKGRQDEAAKRTYLDNGGIKLQ